MRLYYKYTRIMKALTIILKIPMLCFRINNLGVYGLGFRLRIYGFRGLGFRGSIHR